MSECYSWSLTSAATMQVKATDVIMVKVMRGNDLANGVTALAGGCDGYGYFVFVER